MLSQNKPIIFLFTEEKIIRAQLNNQRRNDVYLFN